MEKNNCTYPGCGNEHEMAEDSSSPSQEKKCTNQGAIPNDVKNSNIQKCEHPQFWKDGNPPECWNCGKSKLDHVDFKEIVSSPDWREEEREAWMKVRGHIISSEKLEEDKIADYWIARIESRIAEAQIIQMSKQVSDNFKESFIQLGRLAAIAEIEEKVREMKVTIPEQKVSEIMKPMTAYNEALSDVLSLLSAMKK